MGRHTTLSTTLMAPRWRIWCAAALLVVFIGTSGTGLTARASAFAVTVTTTADSNHSCATTGTGTCSLRDAIRFANTKTGADTTTLSLLAGTYTLTQAGANEDNALTGDLDIKANLTLNGAGANATIINGGGIDRVFDIFIGSTTISGVTIRNGKGQVFGGGILIEGGSTGSGTLALINSAVSGNAAISGGGGIWNERTLTLTGSTVSGNTTIYGGGIYNDGTLTMTNSTVSGNTATGTGGGIFNNAGARVTATVISSTVSGNVAPNGVGGIENDAPTNVRNTILANATGGNCATGLSSTTLASGGYNLSSDTTCAGLSSGTGDLIGLAPHLDPLQDNGGPTQTQAPLPGSPAIDAVPVAACSVATDQRGVARPQGAACDIGAYEYTPPSAQPSPRPGPGTGSGTPVPPIPVGRGSGKPLLVYASGIVPPTVIPGGNNGCITPKSFTDALFGDIDALLKGNYAKRYNFSWRRADSPCDPTPPGSTDGDPYGPSDTYKDLDGAASLLNIQINAQLATMNPPASRVDIVTHSMGGAMVLNYIYTYRPQFPIRIVLLDSPIKGCTPANNACHFADNFYFTQGKAWQQLQDPTFVQHLESAFSMHLNDYVSYAAANQADRAINYSSAWPRADQQWSAGMHMATNSSGQDTGLSTEIGEHNMWRVIGDFNSCTDDAFACHGTVLHLGEVTTWITIALYGLVPALLPPPRGGPVAQGASGASAPIGSAPTVVSTPSQTSIIRTATPTTSTATAAISSTPVPVPASRSSP